ncbi:MAG: hypothetical protein MK137_02365 [Rickettsiales bacterium]|nr:hypothetical protein [Rickettsiales bacterium]
MHTASNDLMLIVLNAIGILGVMLILLAYALSQMEKISSKDYTYQFLNLFGAIFIMLSLIVSWNLPTFIIEICWFSISVYGIYKIRRRRKQETLTQPHSNTTNDD